MLAESFKAISNSKLSKQISIAYPSISYGIIMKIIREKDVKVNGKRVSKDVNVFTDDDIIMYIREDYFEKKFDTIYEDNNIIIVFKYRKIEVSSPNKNVETIETLLKEKYEQIYAVHRLDMNTIGLVVFAKNETAKMLLDDAFRNRTIDKYYLAIVESCPFKQSDKMVAFLMKDSKDSIVRISDFQQNGYERIETKYEVIKNCEDYSLLEVKLITGKTHQIRAHLAHIGHPILGDEKYGNFKFNKKYKLKYQCLCAYKFIFHFDRSSILGYLDGELFMAEDEQIDFLNFCK